MHRLEVTVRLLPYCRVARQWFVQPVSTDLTAPCEATKVSCIAEVEPRERSMWYVLVIHPMVTAKYLASDSPGPDASGQLVRSFHFSSLNGTNISVRTSKCFLAVQRDRQASNTKSCGCDGQNPQCTLIPRGALLCIRSPSTNFVALRYSRLVTMTRRSPTPRTFSCLTRGEQEEVPVRPAIIGCKSGSAAQAAYHIQRPLTNAIHSDFSSTTRPRSNLIRF